MVCCKWYWHLSPYSSKPTRWVMSFPRTVHNDQGINPRRRPQTVSQFSTAAQRCSTLQPYGLQYARLPCPTPTPRAYSNSYPSSRWWCHPSSVIPFSSCLSLSQHQGLFKWVSSSCQVAKELEFQLQHQSFQWIFRTNLLYDWLVWSPCCPRVSQESPPTPQFKSINSSALSFLYGPTLISMYNYWKNQIALTIWTFVSKLMSLLFNMLSRFVIAFLPRSKRLLISWLQSSSAVIWYPPK